MKNKYLLFRSIIFFLLFSLGLNAQNVQSNMSFKKLENGPEVLNVYYDLVPLVNVVVVIKTGLKDESPSINGVSHMLEHMLFNGTKKRTQEVLYREIDRNGFYINAQTGDDYIAFTGLGNANQFDNLLEIMSDMIFNSIFPVEKFSKEKGIILAELERSENSPRYKKELQEKKWIYGTKSIYSYPVLGSRETIREISREQLIRFYKTHFKPENMVVVTYGQIENENAYQIVAKYFGSGKNIRDMNPAKIPDKQNPVVNPEIRIFKDEKYTRLQLKLPGPAPTDFLFPFFLIMNETIFNNPSFLMNMLPDSMKANVISLDPKFEFHPDNSYLLIDLLSSDSLATLKANENKYKQLLDSVIIQIGEIATPEKLGQWLSEYKQQELLNFDKPMYFAFLKSKLLSVLGVENYLKLGPFIEKYLSQFQERYRMYVNQVLRQGRYGSDHLFVDFQWKPELKSRKHEGEFFKKDVKIIIKPHLPVIIAVQNEALPLSAVHILFKNRLALEKRAPGAVELLHWLMGKQSKNFKQEEIDSILAQYSIDVKWHDFYFIPYDDYYFTSEWGYVRSLTLAENQTKQFEMLAELIQNLTFDQEIFERTKKELLYEIKKKEKNVIYKVKYSFYNKLTDGHSPKAYPPYGYSDSIEKYDQEFIRSLFKSYTPNENLIISVISPAEPEKIAELIEMQFIQSNPEYLSAKDSVWRPSTPFIDSIPDPQKTTNQNFYAGFPIDRNVKGMSDVSLKILSRILNQRIQFEIREKKGWAYSIGSSIEKIGNQYFLICKGAVRKGKLDSSLTIIKDIIERLLNDGIAEDELIVAQKSIVAGLLRRYSSAENLAYFWGYTYFKNGLPSDHINIHFINHYIEQVNRSIDSSVLIDILKNIKLSDVYLMYSY